MQVHVLSNEEALDFMRAMTGMTLGDDLRRKLVQCENTIFKAITYHHGTPHDAFTGGTWWQNVMADSLEAAEVTLKATEARLKEIGEDRTGWKEDAARVRCGFFPYQGHMADYMAAHLAAQS